MSVAINSSKHHNQDRDFSILENLSDAAFCVFENGDISWMNQAASTLNGSDPLKNIKELQWAEHFSSEGIFLKAKPFQKEMIQFPGLYEDVMLQNKRVYEMKVQALEPKMILLFFRDTTQKREMERELLKKHQELLRVSEENQKQNFELKSSQAALIQAGKLASLGELTAGIAHELNQPLQVLKGYSQELNTQLSMQNISKDLLSYFEEIVRSVDKMSEIIQALRAFSVKSTDQFTEVNVEKILTDLVVISSKNFKQHEIDLQLEIQKKGASVFGNETQLRQVIMNFLLNAKDALNEFQGLKSKKIKITLEADTECVRIQIEDNGIGMNEETKNKIFQPFFTTKEVGQGMGLGLSLSYGILKELHGSITVESQYKKGTKFLIKIPIDFRGIHKKNKGERNE